MVTENLLHPCPACKTPAVMITTAVGSYYGVCSNIRCGFTETARASFDRINAAKRWNDICEGYLTQIMEINHEEFLEFLGGE